MKLLTTEILVLLPEPELQTVTTQVDNMNNPTNLVELVTESMMNVSKLMTSTDCRGNRPMMITVHLLLRWILFRHRCTHIM